MLSSCRRTKTVAVSSSSNWRLSVAGNGAVSFTANQEIQRPNFFVLLEVWMNANAFQAFENLAQTEALLAQIQPLLEAPLDVRPGTLIE
jgi:quinol monooxygenase YgiN